MIFRPVHSSEGSYKWEQQATILEPHNPQKVKKDKRRPAEMRPSELNFVGNA
jgi:hypothetical protein